MTKDQGTGIVERLMYGAILALAMKFVGWGWLDPDMAPYIAAGGVGLAGGAWAWWINRPGALLTAAGNQLPQSAHLAITTSPSASALEKTEVRDLANSASDKVVAKISEGP
jgi:hypothetical protein